MTNLVFEKQRAERFAQLLDEAGGRPRRHVRTSVDDQLTELVAVGKQLSNMATATAGVHAGDEFKVGLRAMLIARAERDGIGVTAAAPEVVAPARSVRPARSFGLRGRARAAVLVGLAAGTLTLSSFSAASDDAVPGDSLYIFKRQTEKAQLAIAGSNISRGQLYLAFAKTRADEAKKVQNNPEALQNLLTDMDNETYLGVRLLTTAAVERRDAAPLNAVTNFVTSQRNSVSALLNTVPADSRQRVITSLNLLEAANKRASDLRNTLHCPTSASTATDRLGPQAGTCVAKSGNPTQTESGGNKPTGGGTGSTGTGTNGTTPSQAPNGAPSADPSASTGDQTTTAEQDDGGLIDQLGRLLGGLLGG